MATYRGEAVCECGERMGLLESSDMSYVSGALGRFTKAHEDYGHHVLTPQELFEQIGFDESGRLKESLPV